MSDKPKETKVYYEVQPNFGIVEDTEEKAIEKLNFYFVNPNIAEKDFVKEIIVIKHTMQVERKFIWAHSVANILTEVDL